MFERYYFYAFIIIIIICATGCRTVREPVIVATDESIIRSQESIARLEAINGGLRDILSIYDLIIEQQSGSAIRGINDALASLDRYDDFVQECIRRIIQLERNSRTQEPEDNGS